MIVPVILAGGIGSRLWPVSRKAYPKQFISFQSESDSLFKQALTRLEGIESVSKQPIIMCNEEHRFLVAEQLRELGVDNASTLLEPIGRNTAPAVALAALEALRNNEDAILLVLAADHLITDIDRFHDAIRQGETLAQQGKLVTFGIVADKPVTAYGYIHFGKECGEESGEESGEETDKAYIVDSFVEKPDLETAQAYLESGEYLWNSGMFMFLASRFLQELEACNPEMHDKVCKAYEAAEFGQDFISIPEQLFAQCPSDSIDYAVMEKTDDAVVVPLDAGWNDLGSWSALWQQGEHDLQGNAVTGDAILQDVNNSYIYAESRLVSLVGIDDVVVVETKDAVLVSRKDRVQDVKQIVDQLKDKNRAEAEFHNKVYRPWGSYESLAEEAGFQVKRIVVNPKASLSLQLHHHRSEHWTVVKGSAQVTCGEEVLTLQANESIYIPLETKHRLENLGQEPVVVIEVQCGSYLGEDDIVRFEDIYGRNE